MINTKLILMEGLPGAGKSTSTKRLGTLLQEKGIACRFFLEDSDSHPIPCLDLEIKGLTPKMVPLWTDFINKALQEPGVTIIESRLWQNTALFMYMSEMDIEEIIQYNQKIGQVLAPLAPVLFLIDQDDTETALRRTFTTRGEKQMQRELETTAQYPWFKSRGKQDFAGWVQFFEEWQQVARHLYHDWPHRKKRILNPHEDWAGAYEQMVAFLKINGNQRPAGSSRGSTRSSIS